jgi:hypothetical protein
VPIESLFACESLDGKRDVTLVEGARSTRPPGMATSPYKTSQDGIYNMNEIDFRSSVLTGFRKEQGYPGGDSN